MPSVVTHCSRALRSLSLPSLQPEADNVTMSIISVNNTSSRIHKYAVKKNSIDSLEYSGLVCAPPSKKDDVFPSGLHRNALTSSPLFHVLNKAHKKLHFLHLYSCRIQPRPLYLHTLLCFTVASLHLSPLQGKSQPCF